MDADLILAIAAAATAAALLLPADARSGLSRWIPSSSPRHARRLRLGTLVLAVVVLAIAVPMLRPSPHHALVAATAIAVAWSAMVLARRGRRRTRRATRRLQAVDICDARVTELRGRDLPPVRPYFSRRRSPVYLDRLLRVHGLESQPGRPGPHNVSRRLTRPLSRMLYRVGAGVIAPILRRLGEG